MDRILIMFMYAPAGCALFVLLTAAFLAYHVVGSVRRPFFHSHVPNGVLSHTKLPYYWKHRHDPKTDFGVEFEDVEFPSSDGCTLRGWFIPAKADGVRERICIVCTHGGGRDRRAWLRHTPFLHSAGFNLLLYDSRDHGTSDGPGLGLSHGIREHEDALSASSFVARDRGISHVVFMGTSVGAASSIVAAARAQANQALVAASGTRRRCCDPTWHWDSMPHIAGVIAENPFSTLKGLVKGLVAQRLFWYGAACENRFLYGLLFPINKLTQVLVAAAVMRQWRAIMAMNAANVSHYRKSRALAVGGTAVGGSAAASNELPTASPHESEPSDAAVVPGAGLLNDVSSVERQGGFHGLSAEEGMLSDAAADNAAAPIQRTSTPTITTTTIVGATDGNSSKGRHGRRRSRSHHPAQSQRHDTPSRLSAAEPPAKQTPPAAKRQKIEWRLRDSSSSVDPHWEWQEPEEVVSSLSPIPLFIMHGTRDKLIHVEHSLRLYAAAREPKQLWVAEGSDHCQLFDAYPAEYEARVLGFINSCVEHATIKA